MADVLVVDDEQSMREFLEILLQREQHAVSLADSLVAARRECQLRWPELVFVDLKLPDGSGLDLLRWMREREPDTQVIMMTAFATTENAVAAMRLGAYDYQAKPFKVDELREITSKALEKRTLLRENRQLRAQLQRGGSRIVARSPSMLEVLSLVDRVAPTRTSVLIEGESGTGKELVARAIHEASPRQDRPFVAINCGAMPEPLIESELFGHTADAYTGASRQRGGLFLAAHEGTLFLDEVSELSPAVQVKLLRVLEERRVRPVGSEQEREVDVRIIAATNSDLSAKVQDGSFREDLYYRLNVVRLRLPALRERTEDIPLLANAFTGRYAEEMNKTIEGIDGEVMRMLGAHDFPGNVRELKNLMERAVTLAAGPSIQVQDLPEELRARVARPAVIPLAIPESGIDLEDSLAKIERQLIEAALQRCGGVKTRAAELLGLSFRSLRYRLQKLNMESDEQAASPETPEPPEAKKPWS